MKRLFLLAAIMIAASSIAFADLAPPPGKSSNRVKKPDPGISTTLVIKLDRNEKVARLEVPRSQIKQLRAELEQLDTDGNAAGVLTDGAFTRTQTIVSGLFLSLAVVLAECGSCGLRRPLTHA